MNNDNSVITIPKPYAHFPSQSPHRPVVQQDIEHDSDSNMPGAIWSGKSTEQHHNLAPAACLCSISLRSSKRILVARSSASSSSKSSRCPRPNIVQDLFFSSGTWPGLGMMWKLAESAVHSRPMDNDTHCTCGTTCAALIPLLEKSATDTTLFPYHGDTYHYSARYCNRPPWLRP